MHPFSEIYAQIECTLTPAEIEMQTLNGLFVVMIFIVITNVYLVHMYYIQTVESLREKKYDLQNTNLSDYSVEMVVTNKMRNDYKKYRKDNP